MSPSVLLAAALWLAPSYVLHTSLHEGSHYLLLKTQGCAATVSLLPGVSDRKFHFAETRWRDCSPSPSAYLAPVLAEAVWSTLARALAASLPRHHWLRGVLLAESFSASVDGLGWALGSDGRAYRGPKLIPLVGLGVVLGNLTLSIQGEF